MKLICHNDEGKKIFEDGDNWVWKTEKEVSSTPKNKSSLFPFFAVTKWRYIVDDKETIERLRKEYEKQQMY